MAGILSSAFLNEDQTVSEFGTPPLKETLKHPETLFSAVFSWQSQDVYKNRPTTAKVQVALSQTELGREVTGSSYQQPAKLKVAMLRSFCSLVLVFIPAPQPQLSQSGDFQKSLGGSRPSVKLQLGALLSSRWSGVL